ncbi:pantoate--beta-alanine ligase [Streptomyces sp. NBC_01411]|uniref:pantoate--beta-alanine ligase n=1 Tax=Streptomyces sp. NBC_01411 TaxID=2903857 RepID=UPI0032477D36
MTTTALLHTAAELHALPRGRTGTGLAGTGRTQPGTEPGTGTGPGTGTAGAHGARTPQPPAPRAVVMTMGALHEGHATLVRAAREQVGEAGQVVVTVFVNPLQFGAGEDLDRYPRTLEADLAIAELAGADAVFAPSADEVYPGGEPQVRVAAGPMGERFEGAARPGHFDGMLTVVAKLLHLTRPDVALFGQKDAQQLALVRRMARDLNFPVGIVGVPTVREPDGLAMSSRNRFLSTGDRATALSLSRALFAGRDALTGAASATPAAVRAAAQAVLDGAALSLDYLSLIDPSDFTEATDGHRGEAILAVAARVGTTRLIDNIPLTFGEPQ